MGSMDCYCAMCGGPMTRVAIKRTNASDENARSADSSGEAVKGINEDKCIYDLTSEEVEWLMDCRVLGYDPDAPDTSKTFISCRVKYHDYGCMYYEKNPEEPIFYDCYSWEDPDDPATIPFHWDCYGIFSRVLTGSNDPSRINKDALYAAMMSVSGEFNMRLNVKYSEPGAEIAPRKEQFWIAMSGEETLVTSPLPVQKLSEATQSALEQISRMPPLESRLGTRVASDPFGGVPRIVRDTILEFLDHDSLMNLLLASWNIHSTTHEDNGFWKMRIKQHTPWLLEAEHLFQAHSAPEGGMKGLYLWAQTATLPKMHIKKPLRAIVNRRRIWYICSQIADLYLSHLEKPFSPADFIRD